MNLNDLSPGCLATPESQRCDATLPDNPQCTLNVHFGMLLGVDELRTEQGFHLGRSRRHQRLLHGSGVVAGYAVQFDAQSFDLHVTPGLAVDALGRDLALDQDLCVNLVQWWLKHQQDEDFDDIANPRNATVDLDISVCYSTCLSHPVPAIAEPCAGNASDIAYSRVCETVSMALVRRRPPAPGAKAPVPPGACTPRAALAEALAQVSIQAPDPVDAADLCLSVACLRGVHLRQEAEGWQVTVQSIDYGVRPLLLSTGALQSLLLPALASPPPVAGPQVLAAELHATADQITLAFDQKLAAASVQPIAFAVSEFDTTTGWASFTVQTATYSEALDQPPSVVLALDRVATGALLRITVIGQGSTPLLGHSLIPAGATHPECDGRALTTTLHRG